MNQNKSIAEYRVVPCSASRGGKCDIIHKIQHTETLHTIHKKYHKYTHTRARARSHTHKRMSAHAHTHTDTRNAYRSKFMNLLVLLYYFQLMGESVKTRK